MNNVHDYCVVYRTGGTESFRWHRSLAMSREDLADLLIRRVEILRERKRLVRERDDLDELIRERDFRLAELDRQIETAEALLRSRP